MKIDPAKCYASLSFDVPPQQLADFESLYIDRVAPLLKGHGLSAFSPEKRPTAKRSFYQIFEFPSLGEFFSTRDLLRQDPALQQALCDLEEACPIFASGDPLLWHFVVHATPAGPGEITSAGSGNRLDLWQSFCIRDGLPSATINDILQDRRGDLWLATAAGGACRYDGTQFTTFTIRDGLASNTLWSILEDCEGNLWFGTESQGVSRYDGQRFTTFTTQDGLVGDTIGTMAEDREGNLWFATGDMYDAGGVGVSRFDGRHFTTFTTRDGLASDHILAIAQDREDHLWFGTYGHGVSRYDGQHFTTFTTQDGLAGDAVTDILTDRNGDLWFSTGWLEDGMGGVSRFDGHHFSTFTARDGLASDHVLSIAEDRGGDLWFGTYGHGVSRYDGQHFTTFTTQNGLAGNQVWSIFEDRQKHLWFATQGGGIGRYDGAHCASFTTQDGLADNGVMCIREDHSGGIWFGTWHGVCRYDGTKLVHIEELAEHNVPAILEDRQGRLWFGTSDGNGLIRYDGESTTTFTTDDGLPSNAIPAIAEDRDGNLWLGGGQTEMGGVCRYDGADFTTFTTPDSLADQHINAILEDRSGRIWFAAWVGGVSYYDGERFVNLTTRNGLAWDSVLSIAEDRDGNLWFGTFGDGVSRYDGRNFITLTARDGLPSNVVTAILEDDKGHLWFGTYGGGVCRYDGLVFQNFSRKDGLVHDAVQDIRQDTRGNIWIATEGGVTRYRPWRTSPSVRFTYLIADRRYRAEEEIHLPISQRIVTFEFQGRSFTTAPDQMAYVYRLEGRDADWQVIYGGRVEYQDLEQGSYTFHVRAVDRDLNYSEPASLSLIIEPDPHIQALTSALNASSSTGEFIGQSNALRQVEQRLAEVAPTHLTVLILGETGTGKGLAARAIHRLSQFGDGPLIQVNCGAIPEGLVESELFGHERGAFTGAVSRKLGKVELAKNGTLFLDEIGDMPLEAQVKLLRLLEERTFERIGGAESLSAEVRVVAATNRDLRKMVDERRFREDLYFRLQPFPVRLPPLRERREDIPLLALYFMERMAAHLSKPLESLSMEAMQALQEYDWPGNVRELEHVVQRAVILCPGVEIQAREIFLDPGQTAADPAAEILPLEEYERRYIRDVLEKTGWLIGGEQGAATRLGLRESTLRSRMKKLGIVRPRK
ncbi:MAG: sigma 54-interacting transcriptional regulator [Gemmatimonadetes bacterium]|jgi:DNA-binding NtrC family response regulator/ligand-binding sensor domain-containing protein|nr:sigma 54-interacting transcriptional regulator [Gemmatimonadota bacterium]